MPVIVVGADAVGGHSIVQSLLRRDGEVRAFVTDAAEGMRLREAGAKVATGDVSDFGHVEAAMTGCFSAVFLTRATVDHRERSFAESSDAVVEGWREAVRSAAVRRSIWISAGDVRSATPEHVVLDESLLIEELAARVATLDEADSETWRNLTAG